jgi:hypothetical protein
MKLNPDRITTILGTIAGTALAFVLFAPEYFEKWPVVIAFAKFAAAGGIVGLGVKAAGTRKVS